MKRKQYFCRMIWLLLFMLLPVAGLAYVGWHLWVLLPLASGWKAVVIALCLLCFLTMFLDLSGRLDRIPMPLACVLYEVGTSSLIVLLYGVMLFVVLDMGRLLGLVPRGWLYGNWVTTACYLAVLSGILLYGNIHYYNKVRVEVALNTDKPLPHDYKLVMLSDLHLGYHNSGKELSRWVDMINAEKPDLVLIAGDVIDMSIRPLVEDNMAAEFRRLTAPVYACLGNHEYFATTPAARQFYKDAGINLLVDSLAVIDNAICIIGRDDRMNARRKSVGALVASADSSLYTIVLDHQPAHLSRTSKADVDFQLSGHTHRGQVWPISWITDVMYECSWGSYQLGKTHYYVSSGMGIWGGKFRIGTQSEYVVASLSSTCHRD